MKKRNRKLSRGNTASLATSPGNQSVSRSRARFPIVGIGASAGGLEAFTDLLRHVLKDTGFAFVLVQHLDPQHESALPQILSRTTSMPVHEVTNDLRVQPNHVYVIPPNTNMGIEQGVLKLHPREARRTPTRSIDFFFESLAHDQQDCAMGVVLSGTATDGTLGLEAIKAEGGITFAQDQSAKYDSMPRSAVAAGCVDFVLNPQEIANELARLAKHPFVGGQPPTPPEEDPTSATGRGEDEAALRTPGTQLPHTEAHPGGHGQSQAPTEKTGENGFKKILQLLRNHSGVDFSLYKVSTIHRRITRRTVLNKQDTLEDYSTFLQGNPRELDALYSDVLISVTSFFRNPEAFDILKGGFFSKLLQSHSNEPIRVWVLGCSTGQEAYSIVMAFLESSENATRRRKLQVFATDLNDTLLERARHGLYAKTLTQDISPERLSRFFVEEEGGFRVIKPLREMVVFAKQNIISDPPFSRLDLISCRNLLIYLEPNLQKRIFPVFHYALKPGGILFLGGSESAGTFLDLFEPVDKKHKIYSRRDTPTPAIELPAKNDRGERSPSRGLSPTNPAGTGPGGPPEALRGLNAQREADRISVNQFAPPGVLVNAEFQVLQFRGPTSTFLQPPPTGKASFHLLKMAKEGLMLPLRAALNKAKKENTIVRKDNVSLQEGGTTRKINLQVIPLKNLRDRCFLVLFEDAEKAVRIPQGRPQRAPTLSSSAQKMTRRQEEAGQPTALEAELTETRDYLQSIQEQHEAANEELQASNEEVQSANEELQSINEELETSKEELESANEELTTVNEEMANRNAELNRLNADLNNLQSSTKLPVLLLARDLIIRRFSASAEKLFDLTAADVGRSIREVRHGLFTLQRESESPADEDATPLSVQDIAREVIDTLRDQECEVRDKHGRSYSLRVRPYMTLDNKVDGAVLVLVDITERLRLEKEVRTSERRYRRLFEEAKDGIIILDSQTRKITEVNPSIIAFLRYSKEQLLGKELWEIGLLKDENANREAFRKLKEDGFIRHENLPLETQSGERREVELVGNLYREDGHEVIQCNIRDISERKHIEHELAEKARLLDLSNDAIIVRRIDNTISLWNKGAEKLYGWTFREVIGKDLHSLLQTEFPKPYGEIVAQLERDGHFNGEVVQIARNGRRISSLCRWVLDPETKSILTSYTDITERREAEDALRKAHEQRAIMLESAVIGRTGELTETNKQLEAFVYSIAHDLRAPLRAMQGFSAMLVEEAAQVLSDAGRDYAERINKAAQHMDALLKDLLDFSRISQQRVELHPVSLETVVSSVLAQLQKEIQEKNARVESVGPWPTVLAHETTLWQVIFNLGSNALKFARPNAEALLRLRVEEFGQVVRLWVEDDGIGIALEHQEQIFRLFMRLHGEKYPGTGIGLAIVQTGIARMGGRVGLESSIGEGSRFWLELRKGTYE